MFNFLKEKIKSAVSSVTDKITKQGKEEHTEQPVEETAKTTEPAVEQEEPQQSDEESSKKQEEPQETISTPESTLDDQPKQDPQPSIDSSEPTPETSDQERKESSDEKVEITSEEKPVEEEKPKEPESEKTPESSSGFFGSIKKVFTSSPAQETPSPEVKETTLKPTPPPIKEEKIDLGTSDDKKEQKPDALIPDIPKEEKQPLEETEKKGFFHSLTQKITTTKISQSQFDTIFFDLELALLENNVAVEVIDKIKDDLQKNVVDVPLPRSKIETTIVSSLKSSVEQLFEDTFDLLQRIKEKQDKPFVIAFLGINGSGKTTTIAKCAQYLQQQGMSIVLAAADTFRAASIEQLSTHGEKLGVNVIKHDYGSDPAAVAFDAIKHAKSKNTDVVLIDTAGRMHQNTNLMDEMKKIIRIASPDLKLFIGESITGNDCIEQAKSFNDAVSIDGIILSKADIDQKGGAAVSVSYVTKKPILFFGTGQEYADLKPFDPDLVVSNLGLT